MRIYLVGPDFSALADLVDAGHSVALAETLTELPAELSPDAMAEALTQSAAEEMATVEIADVIVHTSAEPDPTAELLAAITGVPIMSVGELLEDVA